jgi:hypothetical protein
MGQEMGLGSLSQAPPPSPPILGSAALWNLLNFQELPARAPSLWLPLQPLLQLFLPKTTPSPQLQSDLVGRKGTCGTTVAVT